MNTSAPGRWLPAAAVLATALFPAPLLAQKLAIEKTHDVSGKAKRGFLDDVNINEGLASWPMSCSNVVSGVRAPAA